MNYMLFIYIDHEKMKAAIHDGTMPMGCDGLEERLQSAGKYVASGRLQLVDTATTLRIRDGKKIVTDGPFAETREFLAGFQWITAQDLDEALGFAAQHPVAKIGSIEVRPIFQYPHDSNEESALAAAGKQ